MTKLNNGTMSAQATHANKYVYFTQLSALKEEARFQLHIHSTNPSEHNLSELLNIKEVQNLLSSNDILLSKKMVSSIEFFISYKEDGCTLKSRIYNIYFNITGDDYLNKLKVETLFNKIETGNRKMQLEHNPEHVNFINVIIKENGSITTSSRQINKSPYTPASATDVLHINSHDINRNYAASELMDLLGYSEKYFQLISCISHDNVCDRDENKYYMYLMKK